MEVQAEQRSGQDGSKTRKALKRFAPADRGSVSIEFAMLAIPFTMLVLAILETCISFAAQQIMANAADDLARELRTGQLSAAAATDTVIFDRICDKISIIVPNDCPGLVIDLRNYPTFEDASKVKVKLTSDRDLDTTGFAIDPGLSESKNMLRVFYKWPVMLDVMRKTMSNIKDNKTLLMAMTTWQNEPFDD